MSDSKKSLHYSGHQVFSIDEFATQEWHRLNSLYNLLFPRVVTGINRYLTSGNRKLFQRVIDRSVIEIGARSAAKYGVSFNAPDYAELSEEAASNLIKVVIPERVKPAVQRIIPRGLPTVEKVERLKTDGLDLKTAMKIERWRQGNPDKKDEARRMVTEARNRRVNLIVRTEVPRLAGAVLDKLWLDALAPEDVVVKANFSGLRIQSDLTISGGIIPRYARKYWVTRRDGKVCLYCAPLEGLTTRVGEDFITMYGTFSGPPIHPQCRCVPVLSARGRRP